MSPEKITHEIPLAALGRLSKSEEIELEAALADDPQLAAELREHEEIITSLWHSSAPLQTMPRSAWGELQKRLHESNARPSCPASQFTKWFGALGWAAAFALALFLWSNKNTSIKESTWAQQPDPEDTQTVKRTRVVGSHSNVSEAERNTRLRLSQMREQLATALAERDSATLASQVIELYAPGESDFDSPEVRSRRLLDLLTEALGRDLQKLDEESVSLIIEEGWLDVALQSLPEDAKIRHRTFPTDNFGEFDLLRSPKGEYFDPTSNFLWKPAPDGGGYLGTLAPADLDLSQFIEAGEIEESEDPSPTETLIADVPEARGYLVRNEAGGSPSFVLNGVDPSTDALTIRQGNRTAYLEPPLLASASPPQTTIGENLPGSNFTPSSNSFPPALTKFQPGPQLMEITENNSDQIKWSEPFQVIRSDALGNASVILTTKP